MRASVRARIGGRVGSQQLGRLICSAQIRGGGGDLSAPVVVGAAGGPARRDARAVAHPVRPALFRRAVRFALPALAVALAAGGLLLPSAPAEAQTATVLVKNTGQTVAGTSSLTTSFPKRAQGFTTGSNAGGYSLSAIGVEFAAIGSVTTVGSNLTVTVNAVSTTDAGDPGDVVCTLAHPATYVANALNTYDASGCPTLAANRTYFLVLERTDSGTSAIALDRTSSTGDDLGASAGWSIADVRDFLLNNSWSSSAGAHLIEITGAEFVPPPPARVTGFDLDGDNDSPVGVWGNDETIWVVDNDAADSKIFAYKRSDGSRDSAKDFDSLIAAGNTRPQGICSDGTTMFVSDSQDEKVYAYKMSDRMRDSTKDITLAAANSGARGVWCDVNTVWVANDSGLSTGDKIFAYKRSDGSHDSDKDMESLYVSTAAAGDNATLPRGLWSDGTTMFVADDLNNKVFAFKLSDESQDSAKNLTLDSDNADPEGLWFDGRVLWVVDDADDRFYVYDLQGAQPDNTPAVGDPEIRTHTTEDAWTATVTAGTYLGVVGYADDSVLGAAFGSLSGGATFTLDEVTYTVRAVWDQNSAANVGHLLLVVDSALPRDFTISVDGVSYSSADAAQRAVTGGYEYVWSNANLSWSTSDPISVVLSVESVPAEGVEVAADVSGITDSTDGLDNVFFHYQWIRVDGTTVTELDGETSSTYTPVAADVGKDLKVRVVFDDDDDNKEYPRTSDAVGPVAPAVTVSFGQAVYAVAEAATTTVKVKLSADPKRKVVVPLVVTNQGGASNSDYSGVPTSVTFASGDTEQSFTFSATDDTVDDDDDSVGLAFGELPAGVTEGATGSATVFIVDDDDPEVTVGFEFATYSVDEGDSDTVKVVLSEDPKREVVVPLTATNEGGASNSDYSGVPSSVTFASGETEKSFTFSAADDSVDDDDESVLLGFGALPDGVTEGTNAEATVSIVDDDVPAVTVGFEHGSYSVAEGASVTVRVRLSAVPERTVTIPISRTHQSGASSSDYSGVPASVTFAGGDTEQSFTFSATQDSVDDDDERVALSFGALPDGVTEGTNAEATVSIVDDDVPAVTVGFEHGSYSVAEGASVTVRVRLSAVPERTVTVPISRTNQGGASSSDYSGVPNSVTFAGGDTVKSFTFSATDDSVDDDGERVRLSFGALPAGVTAGTTNVATVSITDDDDPAVTVSFEHGTYSVGEGATVAVRVELSANPERTVTIPISRTNQSGASSSDYSGVPASVTFNSGETVKSITFRATQDSVDDDGEKVRLSFGTPLPARVTEGTTNVATVSIVDDDLPNQPPTVSATAVPGRVGGGGTVSLDGTAGDADGDSLTFAWSSDGGGTFADDSALDTTWTAPAATQSEQVVTLTLTVTDDGAGFASASATVTVVVEAAVTFTPSALSLTEGESGSYEVVLNEEPTADVTITITAGGSVTTEPMSLSFTPLNWNTPRTVTVRAAQDADGLSEQVTIAHTVATGSAPEYLALGALEAVVVSVTDDDQPGVRVSPTQLTVPEGAKATYTVVLVAEPSANVRVSLQPQSVGITGRSVLLNTYSLEFTPTDWNIPQRVTIDAIHDGDGDDDVVPIRHRVATGSAPEYRGLDVDTLSVTVTDPDPGHAAVLTISTRDQDVAEGGSVTITVKIDRAANYFGGATVRVGLDYAQGLVTGTGQDKPVRLRPPWGSGGTPWATESTHVDLVIAGGDTSKSFTISVRNDSVRSPAGSRRIIVGIIGSKTHGVVKGPRTVVYIHVPEND